MGTYQTAMIPARSTSTTIMFLGMVIMLSSMHYSYSQYTDPLNYYVYDGPPDNSPWADTPFYRGTRAGRNSYFRSSKREDVDMEELVDDLRGEEERYRERENAREKRRIMARYGKISSWKPSQ